MKILAKFPTRSRRKKFFEVLDLYYEYASDIDNIQFVITCDIDDDDKNVGMNTKEAIAKMKTYKNLNYHFTLNKNKIEACNKDISRYSDYDIILLISDDMIPIVKGYDQIIRDNMKEYFPDTDGILWFYDGNRKDLNTLCILGKKYHDRFGYIYFNQYKSFYCDNEFTVVGNILKKQKYFDTCIIEHRHPDWKKGEYDKLYQKNSTMGSSDGYIYQERLRKNFDLKL